VAPALGGSRWKVDCIIDNISILLEHETGQAGNIA
jgi:hypothetical protein